MLDSTYARKQIMRLSALDFFPRGEGDSVARGELLRVLMEAAATNEHAERVISAALKGRYGNSGRACPTPAELRELCSQVPRTMQRAGCQKCAGHAGFLVERRADGSDEARMCDCHPGRYARREAA